MRIVRWATYLWPGLPQLWFDGAWSGLALSVGFSLLLNLLLVASLVCEELLEPAVLRFGWLALGLAWASSLVLMGWGEKSRTIQQQSPTQEDLFRRALTEYLRGAWFEAESLCGQVVANHPRDVDARLMLATLLRRTKRYADAQIQLAQLERIESASKWQAEIELEKRLLKELADTIEDRTQSEETIEAAENTAPTETLTSVSQAA
jgi:hypothetical protein